VAAGAALWQLPHVAREVHADIANGRSLTPLQRALGPTEGVRLVHPEIFLAASKAMPRHALYYVVTGPGVPRATASALGWVRPFAAYWLLPRRRTDDLPQAEWVLAYGGDPASTGLRFRRTVVLGPRILLAEVKR
jgi:hypothetical protein